MKNLFMFVKLIGKHRNPKGKKIFAQGVTNLLFLASGVF